MLYDGDGGLVHISGGTGEASLLPRTDLREFGHNEGWLRDLLFRHPDAIPVRAVDPRSIPLIPLCTELICGSGRVDLVCTDATGRLTLVECKLWRNPDARRRVIAQILDYAAELANWRFGDLEREVSKQSGGGPNALLNIVKRTHPDINESFFCDAISRSLSRGDFMLLIVGDGITQETEQLATFLQDSGNLRFKLGLVEIAPFRLPDGSLVLHSKALARTKTIERIVDRPPVGDRNSVESPVASEPPAAGANGGFGPPVRPEYDMRAGDKEFWSVMLQALRLDDPEQPIRPAVSPGSRRFALPLGAWINCYRVLSQSPPRVGVTLKAGAAFSEEIKSAIQADIESVSAGLPKDTRWQDGLPFSSTPMANMTDPSTFQAQAKLIVNYLNCYVNTFRPLLKRLASDIGQ